MLRLFGMMPRNEIEIERHYKDQYGMKITIQAGPHGWTVLWADGGSDYKDEDHTALYNYVTAKEFVEDKGFTLTDIEHPSTDSEGGEVIDHSQNLPYEIMMGLLSMANNGIHQGKLTCEDIKLFFKEQYGVEEDE